MDIKKYQKEAIKTAIHPKKFKIIYPAIGLGNETGELMGKIKKWMRGDYGKGKISKEKRESIKGELGDVLWYLATLATDLGLSLDDAAQENLKKLKSRKQKNLIKGDGDKR
jgi:NTP pyrophosphatase (non-canonical NTP hydrolase)